MRDDDDRTTAFGLFNYAFSYWQSAAALENFNISTSHARSPIWFLYIHAVELYIKSYLRSQGISTSELRRRFSHNLTDLALAASEKGLQFDDEDQEVLQILADIELTTLRYIMTGPRRRPTFCALDRTCNSLNESLLEVLRAQGNKVGQQVRIRRSDAARL